MNMMEHYSHGYGMLYGKRNTADVIKLHNQLTLK